MAVVSSQIMTSPVQPTSFVTTGQHALPGPSRRGRGRPPGSTTERTDSSLSAASTGPVASTRTKNGCWSCRVRRKKCDEGASGRDGACGNCNRLEIECLGWGAKRPDWMKNKSEVEAWKARVTQSLKDKGMIRGVPRTNPPAPPPFTTNPRVGRNVTPPGSTASTNSLSPVSPIVVIPGAGPIPRNYSGNAPSRPDPPVARNSTMLPSPPEMNGLVPTQSPIHELSEESDNDDYGFDMTDTPGLFADTSGILEVDPMMMPMPTEFPQATVFDQTAAFTETVEELVSPEVRAGASTDFATPYDFSAQTAVAPSCIFGPMPPYVNAGNEWNNNYSGYQQQTEYTPNNWSNGYAYTNTSETSTPYQEPQVQPFQTQILRTPTAGLDQDRLRNMLILYYFKHVRQMQYVFAGDSTTNVMWHHAHMDPQGVVSLALCSLAALHDSRMRIANGIMPNDQRARGPADKYYQKALARLQDNKNRNGILTDADATAALHFVSFWLFTGGTGDWPTALQIAGDWYEQSNLAKEDNPMKALMEMNDNAKHASKTTMWMDIFSSISLCKSPRFLGLYRRLLQPNTWYPTGQRSGLQLENIMGCADGIMLCLAEIADLAHWKSQQQAAGCLSMPELVRRGLVIEKDLRREGQSLYRQQQDNGMWGSVPPRATPSVPPVNLDLPNGPRLDGDQLRRLVSDIFREAAILYLHTELSDLRPQVPEIKRAVKDTVEALKKLPCSEYDRSLVFPLALAGCAADEPEMREYVRCRLKQLSSAVGNCATATELIEHVWKRRDDTPGLVLGWREAMQEIGMTILLV